MQSELLPSACMVELPSKPQRGRSDRAGGFSNCLSRVFPRSSGTGCFPSSQMYSSLYFVIVFGPSVGCVIPDAWLQFYRGEGQKPLHSAHVKLGRKRIMHDATSG